MSGNFAISNVSACCKMLKTGYLWQFLQQLITFGIFSNPQMSPHVVKISLSKSKSAFYKN